MFKEFPLNKKFPWLGGTLLAILLGAVGSGFWEHILSPLTFFLRDWLLNIASWGMLAFKDNTYRTIALGFHEDPSLRLFTTFNAMVGVAILAYNIHLFRESIKLKRKGAQLLQDAESLQQGKAPAKPTIEDLLKQARSLNFKKLTWASYLGLLSGVFLFVFNIVSNAQTSYINSALTHFHLLQTLISSQASEKELTEYSVRLASVHGKSDFAKLVGEMEQRAIKIDPHVESFHCW